MVQSVLLGHPRPGGLVGATLRGVGVLGSTRSVRGAKIQGVALVSPVMCGDTICNMYLSRLSHEVSPNDPQLSHGLDGGHADKAGHWEG